MSVRALMAALVVGGALLAGCGSGSGDIPSASAISKMSCHELAGVNPKMPKIQDLTNVANVQADMDSANAFLQRLLALGGCPSEPGLGGGQLPHLVPNPSQP